MRIVGWLMLLAFFAVVIALIGFSHGFLFTTVFFVAIVLPVVWLVIAIVLIVSKHL